MSRREKAGVPVPENGVYSSEFALGRILRGASPTLGDHYGKPLR